MKHLFLHKYYHNSKQSYISSSSTLVLDSVQATYRDWQKNSDPTTRTYWKGRFITGWYKSPQKQEVPKLKHDFWSSATQFEDLLQNYVIWQFYEFTFGFLRFWNFNDWILYLLWKKEDPCVYFGFFELEK